MPDRHTPKHNRIGRGLGWLSLALSGPPLAATDAFCAALAVGTGARQRATARIVGARELAAAYGLLRHPGPFWLWARVAGDAMDLAVLARALRNHDRPGVQRTAAATAVVGAIATVDLYAAATRSRKDGAMRASGATTISKTPAEVYAFWKQLEHLPQFMAHVDDVRVTGAGRSHWVVSAPFGRHVEWDAETVDDVADRRIRWRSVEGADITNEGAVEFLPAPGGRGTEVRVSIEYAIPAGKLGEAIARYFGEDPHQQLDDDLRRLKQILETGEVIRSEGAPGGKRARREFPQRPAQPLSEKEYAAEVTA